MGKSGAVKFNVICYESAMVPNGLSQEELFYSQIQLITNMQKQSKL